VASAAVAVSIVYWVEGEVTNDKRANRRSGRSKSGEGFVTGSNPVLGFLVACRSEFVTKDVAGWI